MAQKRKSKKQIKQKQKQQQRQSVIVKIDQSKKITRRTPTQSDNRPILPQSIPPQMITIPQYIPQFIPQINPISGEKSIKAEPTELMTSKTAKPQFIGTETPNLESIKKKFDLGNRADAFSELSSNLDIPEYIGESEEIPTTNAPPPLTRQGPDFYKDKANQKLGNPNLSEIDRHYLRLVARNGMNGFNLITFSKYEGDTRTKKDIKAYIKNIMDD